MKALPIIHQAVKGRSLARQTGGHRLRQAGRNGPAAAINLIIFFRVFIHFFESFIMSKASQAIVESQERLVSAIRSEISDAQELLSATADQVGEKMSRLRERIQTRLREAKLQLAEAEAMLVAKTRAAARATDDYVHESPWAAIGIAAGVGVLVGLALSRR